MKKISCTLATLDKAIAELDKFQKELATKAESITSQVTDVCESEAAVNFGKAIYDGTNDVIVSTEQDKLIGYVVASGETVAFIEFGTGITYPDDHPLKPDTLGLVGRGEYGHKLGRMKNGWRYPAVMGAGTNGEKDEKHPDMIHTYGNPANRCLYDARAEAQKSVIKIAKEAFADD